MDNIAFGIERQCNVLVNEVYPAVEVALESAILLCCDRDSEEELQTQLFAFQHIRNEFNSLVLLERKLVFITLKNIGRKPIDNMGELLRLIKNKDLKIQDCLNSLEPFFIDKNSIIRDLRNAFDHLFLIEKQKLYELLIRLMPARYSLFFNESYFSKN